MKSSHLRKRPHPNPLPKGEGKRRNAFDLTRLRAGIKPFRLHYATRLRSTNDHATRLRKRGDLFAPAIVLTSHQIAGRGRGANTWWSGPGCLTVTFVLPIDDQLAPHQIPLLAGLAVRDAVARLSGEPNIQLKWPNDLIFRGRKLAGLLCERVHKADLIGLGLNVNLDPNKAPKLLRAEITSLAQITGKSIDMTDSLIAIARELYRALSRSYERTFAVALKDYDRHHALVGRRVSVADGTDIVSGRCEGLDRTGRLILRDRGKVHHVIAGQVRMH